IGVHQDSLSNSLQAADEIYLYQPEGMDWALDKVVQQSQKPAQVFDDVEKIIEKVCSDAREGDHVIIMSNGGFEAIHSKLLTALEK
ncbi:MAG: UDP-N-acetylmuramate:L-alanyl-gamma-D-glutamyl-meso-diaminopimelate ligase, partial [Gammaproteobacteria bacterium]|nr:UDP-N-acetylmuramate:L-alanyl-gamma-D-glutamyl-meso-diaminopimelate ligase [Gammaproteobacteria bacterium]